MNFTMSNAEELENSPPILEELFLFHPSKSYCMVYLTQRFLSIKFNKVSGKRYPNDALRITDIIGCHIMKERATDSGNNADTASYLSIYSYPLKTIGFLNKHPERIRNVITLKMETHASFEENYEVIKRWYTTILRLMKGQNVSTNGESITPLPPILPYLLIFVNPFSGQGKSLQIFKKRVVPLLGESDTRYKLVITERQNHAREFVKNEDIYRFDGLVVVSGDGLLYEVFNGLMERSDWEKAIKIPVGVIPGGSGNGLARAINHAIGEPHVGNGILSSSLNVIRGRVSPMDLVRVQLENGTIVYSFLSVGWGIMADIDIESERLRALGEVRFTVWGVIRALGLRKYKGRLSYLPISGHKSYSVNCRNTSKVTRSKTADTRLSWANEASLEELLCKSNTGLKERSKSIGPLPDYCEHDVDNNVHLLKYSLNSDDSVFKEDFSNSESNTNGESITSEYEENISPDSEFNSPSTKDNSKQGNTSTLLRPLGEPVPESWVVLDGEFVMVYVSYQSHLAADCFFAPDAKLDDGLMWLVIVHSDISRTQVINFLTSLENGTHINNEYVEVIPVYAFRLEPFNRDGVLTVDGESIPCGPIQAEVLPSLARIMTR